jgi:serine/threonine protein kinase
MGEVYRARDARLGREVALKILPVAFASDPDRVRRFEQEGRAAAALNHPNIVVIYDAGSQDGVFYVATELLEGETLRERLAGHTLPVRKAIDYAVQTARGLAAAHAKGITHRDLKPENLFLTKDGLVKILDFGLAKHSAMKSAGTHPTEFATQPIETDPGQVLGTVGYMSPEQVRGQVADARSDLFSLGVVLYEMVSGKRAFSGDSSVEVMNAILEAGAAGAGRRVTSRAGPDDPPLSGEEAAGALSIGAGPGVCAGIDLWDHDWDIGAENTNTACTRSALHPSDCADGRSLFAARGGVRCWPANGPDPVAVVPADHLPARLRR